MGIDEGYECGVRCEWLCGIYWVFVVVGCLGVVSVGGCVCIYWGDCVEWGL